MNKTIVLGTLLCAASATAQPAPAPDPAPQPAPGGAAPTGDPKAEAKALYEKGLSEYNLGKFDLAIESFTKAYELSSAPGLLFNIAQSHRLNKNYEKASYFYTTYLRLKPDASNRSDVEQRISEMNKLLEEQKSMAGRPPTGTVTPDGGSASNPDQGAVTVGAVETPITSEPKDGGPVDGIAKGGTQIPPKLVSARMIFGVALLAAGDLDVPVQPAFGIVAGYPLPVGPITLELGAGIGYTPLPYEVMGVQNRGTMLGVRAVAAAVYPVTPQIQLRGELGIGFVSLTGLGEGNPLSQTYEAASYTLPSVRFGVSADYLITPNVTATVSPFGLAFSPGADGMYADSLREINVLFGVGYRQ